MNKKYILTRYNGGIVKVPIQKGRNEDREKRYETKVTTKHSREYFKSYSFMLNMYGIWCDDVTSSGFGHSFLYGLSGYTPFVFSLELVLLTACSFLIVMFLGSLNFFRSPLHLSPLQLHASSFHGLPVVIPTMPYITWLPRPSFESGWELP
jgi:hypothetical protein